MRSKLLHEVDALKTYALIFDTGDLVIRELTAFARNLRLGGSQFTAFGGFQDAMLGYFEPDRKDYKKIPIREQVEVLSLVGDVAQDDGDERVIHAHAVLGRSDGTALGGYLLEAHVRPTLELILVEAPGILRRHKDDKTGLALIRI